MGGDGELDNESDVYTEHTPLLGDTGEDRARGPGDVEPLNRPSHHSRTPSERSPIVPTVHIPKVHNNKAILNMLCAVYFVGASAAGFTSVPLTGIVENVVCHRFYGSGEPSGELISERQCKIEPIQSKVAFVFAITGMCEAAVGFLAAFPWGIVADRVGRRPVFSTAIAGMALSILFTMMVLWFPDIFPTELVALDAAFLLIGGGNAVIIGILLSMISDVFPEDKRATAFMRLQVSGLVGHLVSPALSSAMMAATGPWPVMLVAIACLMVAAIGFLFVPETLSHKTRNEDRAEQENQPSYSKGPFLRALDAIRKSLSILKSPSLILLLIICLLATPFTAAVLQFLVQFVSKRYEVLIRDTGYIQSAYGFAQIIQALLLLPWISRIMLKDTTLRAFRMANEQERDLALAKYSFCFVLLGFVVLGATPNLALFIVGLLVLALGSGYSSLVHSIMSLYVDPLHQSQLFCLVGMVEVIGTLFGAPMLAGLFTMGIRFGGGWIGLPYYGLAVLAMLCIGVIFFVRVPKHAATVDVSDQPEDPEDRD